MNRTLLTSILFFAAALGLAQPGYMINYQGRLSQVSGAVFPNGPADLRIKLYDAMTGGSMKWDSGVLTVQVRDGVFSALLQSGTPTLSPTIFLTGQSFFELNVKQGTNWTVLSPRQSVTSVPWSLVASTVPDNSLGSAKLLSDSASMSRVSGGVVTYAGSGLWNFSGAPDSRLRLLGNYAGIQWDRNSAANSWLLEQRSDVGGANDDLKLLRYLQGNYQGLAAQFQLSSGFLGLNGADPTVPLTLRSTSPYGGYESAFSIRNNSQTQAFQFAIFNNGLDIAAIPYVTPNPILWLGANGRIGVGTNTPQSRLHLRPEAGSASVGIQLEDGQIVQDGTVLRIRSGGDEVKLDGNDSLTLMGGFELKSGYPFIDFGGGDFDVRVVNDSPGRLSFYKGGGGWATLYGDTVDQSSKRWKREVASINNPLGIVLQLNGVRYRWDDQHGGRPDIGFLAEDVGKLLPEIVEYEANGRDAIGMRYQKLTAVLVEAMKQQNAQIVKSENENRRLRNELNDLKRRSTSMEARLRALETRVPR